jgi:choline dehydrogenase-like flavoprotein
MTTFSKYIPCDPEDKIWDVVVIGTGAGGATAGFNLARLGKSVIFVERGKLPLEESENFGANDGRKLSGVGRGVWWPEPITRCNPDGTAEKLMLGCGVGGSTTLFCMLMDRFRVGDFTPRRFCQKPESTTLPDAWPITLSELKPYYARAEALFRVRGTEDPLYPTAEPLRSPAPPTEADSLVFDAAVRCGLHPFGIHYAREQISGCTGCFGVHCPHNCRNHAGHICVVPALRDHGAYILPECHVLRLHSAGSRTLRWATAMWKDRLIRIRGRIFVLALNAALTPALLLRSICDIFPNGLGNTSGMVGRNLMTHVSDTLLVDFKHDDCVNSRMSNGVSINDFYNHDGLKLGNIHAHALRFQDPRFKGWAVFNTIVEDFPYECNRIFPLAGSVTEVRWEYHHPQELRDRAATLRGVFAAALRKGGRSIKVVGPEGRLNAGHMCGTCRFGDDPRSSVLNRNNRLHDVDNVYVVDGSFFPSSGGMNPSLTIVANSLRVSDLIAGAWDTHASDPPIPGGEPTRPPIAGMTLNG